MQQLRSSYFQQLRQRFQAMPKPKTEESILLRVLVQALVIVGIIATDIAAETQMSLWAIPLSIAGASWSWYGRKSKNIAAKFLIAMAMLVMMLAFFRNLLANLNDTRLVLAELLVQLQVLHSFDLPRRKDLGYSMVIGIILIGVAGTVSQTLAFAPMLLVFLTIALPVLVLDYRSRLGLATLDELWRRRKSREKNKNQKLLAHSSLSPRRLGIFLVIILALGLLIFALFPRFPGYQLQTFPVSSPLELDEKTFEQDYRGIVNPGYAQGEEEEGRFGSSPTEGEGTVDPSFYYGFNSKMNQNLRGQLEKKLVMRVRSQAPGYWRVLSFDHYTGQGWEVSDDENIETIKRPWYSYRFAVPPLEKRGETKQIIQSYSAVAELPNIIPALSYPKYVFFPTKEIGMDSQGNLRSPLGLVDGLTYTVISQVPYRDRALLQQASTEYPQRIASNYLQIPPEIEAKVREKAEQLLAKANQPITSNYEKTLYLAQAIKQNYSIQVNLPFFSEDEDLVSAFLFRYQGGYPDHFPTVLTVMLRSLGIPARLATGFAPGQFNPFTGYYLVHNTDAYAVTEVYFPEYGWYAFDPIPGRELIPPSFEEQKTFSVLRQFWQWIAGWLPSPVTGFLGNLFNQIIETIFKSIAWLWRFFSSSIIGLFTGLIGAIALVFATWLGWSQLKNFGYRRRLAKLPPIERLYLQMLEVLKVGGHAKHPAQTPLEYAKIAQESHSEAQREVIAEISQAYVSWRYGGQMANLPYLQQQFKALKRSLRKIKLDDKTP